MKPTSLILAVTVAAAIALNVKSQQDPFSIHRNNREMPDTKLISPLSATNVSRFLYPDFLQTASVAWKWDTILCFDDQELPLQRLSQAFDENGNVGVQLIEELQSGTWANFIRAIHAYDNLGQILEVTTYIWQNGTWFNLRRLTLTHNPQGKITMESVEKAVGSAWAHHFRRSYTYDANLNKTGMLQEIYFNGGWVNDLRGTFTYDGSGNMTSALSEYSESGGPWLIGMRFTYTLDPNGNWVEQLIESGETGTWETVARCIYTNDASGNILTELYQYLDNGAWVNDTRKNYAYDAHGNVTGGVNETWQDGSWQRAMQSSYLLFKKEIVFVLNTDMYRFEASYIPFSMGAEEAISQGAFPVIYPNPASNEVFVQPGNVNGNPALLNIYDSDGVLVRSFYLTSGGSRIDIRDLDDGLYLLAFITERGSRTQKLMIH